MSQPNDNGGTPRTDAVWLSVYPHDVERDNRLEGVLVFARELERELFAMTWERDAALSLMADNVAEASRQVAASDSLYRQQCAQLAASEARASKLEEALEEAMKCDLPAKITFKIIRLLQPSAQQEPTP